VLTGKRLLVCAPPTLSPGPPNMTAYAKSTVILIYPLRWYLWPLRMPYNGYKAVRFLCFTLEWGGHRPIQENNL